MSKRDSRSDWLDMGSDGAHQLNAQMVRTDGDWHYIVSSRDAGSVD